MQELKIGQASNSALTQKSKKYALLIPDIKHYKISQIKISYSSSSIIGIELNLSKISFFKEGITSFFIDSFNAVSKQKEIKQQIFEFQENEEIIEIWGKNIQYFENFGFKTNQERVFFLEGIADELNFNHIAPIGHVFTLIKTCFFKENIECIEFEIGPSASIRNYIYSDLDFKIKNYDGCDFDTIEDNIEITHEMYDSKWEFKKYHSDNEFSFDSLKKEIINYAKIDKLALLKYFIKVFYIENTNKISKEKELKFQIFRNTIKFLLKNLKYPFILMDREKKEFNNNFESNCFDNIINLLILCNGLKEFSLKNFFNEAKLIFFIDQLKIYYYGYITVLIMNKEQKNFLMEPPTVFFGHFLGFYKLSMKKSGFKASDLDRTKIQLDKILLRKIKNQDIYLYERQTLIYCLNNHFMKINSVPSVLLGFRIYKEKSIKRHELFFLLTFTINESIFHPITNLSFDEFQNIDKNSFFNNFFSGIISAPFEVLPPKYTVFKSKNNTLELLRIPYYLDPNKKFITKNNGLRNPLFFCEISKIFVSLTPEMIYESRNFSLETALIEFLSYIKRESYLISFECYENDSDQTEKKPVYSLSTEFLNFLYQNTRKIIDFILDHPMEPLINILFAVNPIMGLIQNHLIKSYGSEVFFSLEDLDFELLFDRLPADLKLLFCDKIRVYIQDIKISMNRGNASISNIIQTWIREFMLRGIEIHTFQNIWEYLGEFWPAEEHWLDYEFWKDKIDWNLYIKRIYKSYKTIDLVTKIGIPIGQFNYDISGKHEIINLLQLICENKEDDIDDLRIIDIYLNEKIDPDFGFPYQITAFEKCLERNSHKIIQKFLKNGYGIKVNYEILFSYLCRNYLNIDETCTENLITLINFHRIAKWKLCFKEISIFEQEKKFIEKLKLFKEQSENSNNLYFTLEGEIIKLEELEKTPLESIFYYYFSSNTKLFNLNFQLKKLNSESFLNIAYNSLESLLFGISSYSGIQTIIINNQFIGYELKENFSNKAKILSESLSDTFLKTVDQEQLGQKILMNIILLAGEFYCDEILVYKENNYNFLEIVNPGKALIYEEKNRFSTISCFFCFENINFSVPERLVKNILEIDVFQKLQDWLYKMKILHKNLSFLGQDNQKMGFWLKRKSIFFIFYRLLKIQALLTKNKNITYLQIIKEIDPFLYSIYNSPIKNKEIPVFLEKMKELQNEIFDKWKYVNYSLYIEREPFKSIVSNDYLGPNEILSILSSLKYVFDKNSLIENKMFYLNFDNITLLLDIIKNIDFSFSSKETQEAWLDKLAQFLNKSLFIDNPSLTLTNMSIINLDYLNKINIFKQLRFLKIIGSSLTDDCLIPLSNFPLLESLDLSQTKTIHYFSKNDKSILKAFQPEPLLFQSLKHINLSDCESLISIQLKADIDTISLKNCKMLNSIKLDTISLNHNLNFANFEGLISFPEKEFNKIIKTTNFEIKIDKKTCKEIFSDILKDIPDFPKFPKTNKNSRISGKYLDSLFTTIERKENNHLLEKISLKEMNESDLAKLCQEINKNLANKGIQIKEIDISFNTGIKLGPNISFIKTALSGGFPLVESLNLSGINFTDGLQLNLLGKWIKENKIVKTLILNEIDAKSKGIENLFKFIEGDNLGLQNLSLRRNGIDYTGFSNILADFLSKNNSLQSLDISYNYIDGPSLKIIIKALNFNKTLKKLIIKALSPQNLILKSKETQSDLEKLQNSVITDEYIPDLIDLLHNNRVIELLDLRNHPISSEKIESLYKLVHMSNTLNTIRLKNPQTSKSKILTKQIPIKHIQDPHPLLYQSTFLSRNSSLEKSVRNPKPDVWVVGLSIDGGGMRGIIPAIMLEKLAKECNYPPHQLFDYIGGTSIGGIMALGLTGSNDGVTPICSTYECVQLFETYGKDIFGKLKTRFDPMGLKSNKYDESGLEAVIRNYFKNSLLSQSLTSVLVTSVSKNTNEMIIFDSLKAYTDADLDFFRRNVARATSAAPTYFSSAEIFNVNGTKHYSLVDGGLGKNDPSIFVFEGIEKIANNYGMKNNFMVVSLGTGEIGDNKILSQNPGLLEIKNILNKCLDTPMEMEQVMLKEKYGPKYRRFQPKLIFGKNVDISLDNIDPEIVKIYRTAAEQMAEQFLVENYGFYQNMSLIDWLSENTARKMELI